MSNENNNSFWKNLLNKDNVQPALLTASGAAISYVLYWNLFGNELKTKNKDLEEQLQQVRTITAKCLFESLNLHCYRPKRK